jgi:hypothetical protein
MVVLLEQIFEVCVALIVIQLALRAGIGGCFN